MGGGGYRYFPGGLINNKSTWKQNRKHLYREPLNIRVCPCDGIKAQASNPTSSPYPNSPWWGWVEEMRRRKLITGSTRHFSSHLKFVIIQTASVPQFDGKKNWQISIRQRRKMDGSCSTSSCSFNSLVAECPINSLFMKRLSLRTSLRV